MRSEALPAQIPCFPPFALRARADPVIAAALETLGAVADSGLTPERAGS